MGAKKGDTYSFKYCILVSNVYSTNEPWPTHKSAGDVRDYVAVEAEQTQLIRDGI